ncbi:MAG: c-type cytochrome biogenesis protein CcsB [Bacillaceae bacterium]|nr:c-type cytochrome biogenesis protein CcsB [Bacillaceae bacterium]
MIQLSSNLLLIAFILYMFGSIAFVISVTGRRWRNRAPEDHARRWGWIGFYLTLAGFFSQLGFIILRWMVSGHSPTSNMFEFMAFLGFTIILAFIVLYLIYRIPALGMFAVPVGMIMIAYASVFPKEIMPLIPALQSYWLYIHVTTAALGEGIFAIGFAAGLMYLIRTVDQTEQSSITWWKRKTTWLEFSISVVLMLVGFILMTTLFSTAGYEVTYQIPNEDGNVREMTYHLPSIAGPHNGQQMEVAFGPLFEAPEWMNGRKLNTMLWSILSGIVLYWLIRLLIRKRLSAAMKPWLNDLDPDVIDEISYRSIAIGFPIFTLGALIFAMIWAAEAWGRFWGWDPKEVWALITWLFYSAYLHLRLSRGWHGSKSAWMAVLGFVFVLFTLVFVNLVIAGLHSYAGV